MLVEVGAKQRRRMFWAQVNDCTDYRYVVAHEIVVRLRQTLAHASRNVLLTYQLPHLSSNLTCALLQIRCFDGLRGGHEDLLVFGEQRVGRIRVVTMFVFPLLVSGGILLCRPWTYASMSTRVFVKARRQDTYVHHSPSNGAC